ncbi:hypothetical protein BD289DRAFT_112506 [Coniella lustricola]|uniref:Uncharacterized protein n=1 Tax=Coniella lustricola TaxID=2025994 RepID=A0A2T3AGA2_9PEZI|nr:hypothetical protein BD289DRAFT_112506 [Coniella lustricola]
MPIHSCALHSKHCSNELVGGSSFCIAYIWAWWTRQPRQPSKKGTGARPKPPDQKRTRSIADYLISPSPHRPRSICLHLGHLADRRMALRSILSIASQPRLRVVKQRRVALLLSNLEAFAFACLYPRAFCSRSLAAFPAFALPESPTPARQYPLWTCPIYFQRGCGRTERV